MDALAKFELAWFAGTVRGVDAGGGGCEGLEELVALGFEMV